jgi:reductive dehalogenase
MVMMIYTISLLLNTVVLLIALYFMIESFREKEGRAKYFGLLGTLFHGFLFPLIIFVPFLRLPILLLFIVYVTLLVLVLIPHKLKPLGSVEYIVGKVLRFDERTTVFRSFHLKPGTERSKEFYKKHPELEDYDKKRQELGGWNLGPAGKIDKYYPPTKSMVEAAEESAFLFGSHFEANPADGSVPHEMDPKQASNIIKNYAKHIGADLVGITIINPLWLYSHRGEECYPETDKYGSEIKNEFKYAVVFATEMNYEHVMTAPHTPLVAESMNNYAKGVYISTMLAKWFAKMGYEASAQHFSHFDMVMPPVAIDAGIGEYARNGYLITDKFGARVRLGGVLTNMPLEVDQPISLGVNEFCSRCKKCATSCPSNSIPEGDEIIHNGVKKWKLDDESCYMLWGKFGTDCAICMSVCPYSRPNTPLHRVIRWMVKQSPIARKLFPHIDNLIYGKRWRPKETTSWLANPKTTMKKEVY